MPGREEMLERIREALRGPSDSPSMISQGHVTSAQDLAGVMPPILPEELLVKFEEELTKVGGTAHRAATLRELEEVVSTILTTSDAAGAVLSRNPLLAQLALAEKLRAGGKSVAVWAAMPAASDPGGDEQAAHVEFAAASFQATVGITGVDFALAETGSLVLSSRTEGSQLASLAPPVHVALYRRSQLLGSLDEVLERLQVPRNPDLPAPGRSVVFVTGTSRTADIEQILIRGVHGPREVHAILVEESCLT